MNGGAVGIAGIAVDWGNAGMSTALVDNSVAVGSICPNSIVFSGCFTSLQDTITGTRSRSAARRINLLAIMGRPGIREICSLVRQHRSGILPGYISAIRQRQQSITDL
jgi:hypothetical protein